MVSVEEEVTLQTGQIQEEDDIVEEPEEDTASLTPEKTVADTSQTNGPFSFHALSSILL